MLKTPLSIIFLVVFTSLAISTSVLANDHEMSHEGAMHPAHEMGQEIDTKKDKKLSEEYKENMDEAKDAKNAPHPAHEMGESDELQERGQ